MRSRIEKISRYIVTDETAQHRIFAWLSYPVLPDKNLIVIPREDDLMFGLLQSRFHAVWSLRKGSDFEDRPRYTHTTTFATFPFPEGMTPNVDVAIARAQPAAVAIEQAAIRLNDRRQKYLYPSDQVKVIADLPGFPDRILPKNVGAERKIASLTMTSLYNDRPTWLIEAHRQLDNAVADAYGWPHDLSEDEILRRLLDMNTARTA